MTQRSITIWNSSKAVAAIVAFAAVSAAAQPQTFSPGKASFALKIRGEICPYRVFGVYVLPGEALTIEVLQGRASAEFQVRASTGELTTAPARHWVWRAPTAPGLYPLTVEEKGTGAQTLLNVFVLIPYSRIEGDHLNGYRIGAYPGTPLKGLAIYKPPRGFIEATRENEDTRVSPHFTLKQFFCKQEGGYPKYLVLRERLLLKLEHLLQVVNAKGYRCDTFFIMSGFRTPYYNAVIRNVKYSRHMWGGAADIFIDEDPRDGVMDDLNGDGRIDVRDADLLYDLIETLHKERSYEPFIGGLGRYGSTTAHGPFVHVDARGFRARWGR